MHRERMGRTFIKLITVEWGLEVDEGTLVLPVH